MEKIIFSILIILLIPMVQASLCSEVYHYVLENNWEITIEGLQNISEDTNESYYYIQNYNELCYVYGFPELPEKPEIPIIEIRKSLEEESEPPSIFKPYMPFFKITTEYNNKYLFKIEKGVITGIRVFPIVLLILFTILIIFYVHNKRLNKEILK